MKSASGPVEERKQRPRESARDGENKACVTRTIAADLLSPLIERTGYFELVWCSGTKENLVATLLAKHFIGQYEALTTPAYAIHHPNTAI